MAEKENSECCYSQLVDKSNDKMSTKCTTTMLFQFLSNVAHLAVKCIQKTETHQPEESRIIFEQIKLELIINHIDVL